MEPELSVLRKKQIGRSEVADQLRKFLLGKDGAENDTDISRNTSKLLAALEAEENETSPTAACSDELGWRDPKLPAHEQSIRESGKIDGAKTDADLNDDREDQTEKASARGQTKPKKKGSKLEELKDSDKEGIGTETAGESKASAKLEVDGVETVAKPESKKKKTPSKKKKHKEGEPVHLHFRDRRWYLPRNNSANLAGADSMKKKKEKGTPKKDASKETKLKKRKSSSSKDEGDTPKKTKRKSN
uniref:Uncharacterized protein n=1 Tax=Rhodosorus marinus TaxID=101924 RepID=A0A7S2ZTY5_9RHOD|mmetsp:Transcript_30617/g.117055  ORF Transcript_30617/g.117055 Transcript_30617/m.117055 type:complete len:245 (+) Transcript_30617:46-780(+)